MRVPPNDGEQHDDALGVGVDLADGGGCRADGIERAARRGRRRPRRGPRPRRACPRWPRTADRSPAGRRRRSRPGRSAAGPRRAPRPGRWPWPARCTRCPSPPRVGSRSQRVDGAASSSASTRSPSGAVSERMSASRARSPRASITAIPWSAIVPDTSTTSPGCTSSGPRSRPAGKHADARGGDVEPVGGAAVDHLGVARHDGDAGERERPRPCRPRCRAAR